MAGGTDITSGGTEGTGEGGTKANGAAGLPGGRGGCGVEKVWGGRDGSEDPLGEEKEQVAAKGSWVDAVVARPAGFGGGVPGGVVSIPLSSIIFPQIWYAGGPRASARPLKSGKLRSRGFKTTVPGHGRRR